MERRPDYEDEKIRGWLGPLEGTGAASRGDPTVMSVDLHTEETYESRTYKLRPTEESIQMIVRVAGTSAERRPALPFPLSLALAYKLLEDATLKFLAKQHKDNGEISLLVIATALGQRYLVRPLRRMSENDYRNKVKQFEAEWVQDGRLEPGYVTTPEEWRRYDGSLLSAERTSPSDSSRKPKKKSRRRRR